MIINEVRLFLVARSRRAYAGRIAFFDSPPPDPSIQSAPQRYRMPDWMGPPEHVLPGVVPLELLLVHTPRLAVWLSQADVYPTGMVLKVVLCGPKPGPPGIETGPGTWRFGVQFPDGRKATTFGIGMSRAGGRAVAVGLPRNPDPSVPEGPLLRPRGGAGGRSMWHQDYWLWPAPDGELLVACEWPDLGVELTTATIGADQLQKAAARARQLWPAEDLPDWPGNPDRTLRT